MRTFASAAILGLASAIQVADLSGVWEFNEDDTFITVLEKIEAVTGQDLSEYKDMQGTTESTAVVGGMDFGDHVNSLESSVWYWQNLLRTDPKSFIPFIQAELDTMYFSEQWNTWLVQFPGEQWPTSSYEGPDAWKEAIEYLENAQPMADGAMTWNDGLWQAAESHSMDQGPTGQTGHYSTDGTSMGNRVSSFGDWQTTIGENIAYASYGPEDGYKVISQLFVDDGVPDRGHRVNLFQPKFKTTGVGCAEHEKYSMQCTINYAGGFTAYNPVVDATTGSMPAAYSVDGSDSFESTDAALAVTPVSDSTDSGAEFDYHNHPQIFVDIFMNQFNNDNGQFDWNSLGEMTQNFSAVDSSKVQDLGMIYMASGVMDQDSKLRFWSDLLHGRGQFWRGREEGFVWAWDSSMGFHDARTMIEAATGPLPTKYHTDVMKYHANWNWNNYRFLAGFVSKRFQSTDDGLSQTDFLEMMDVFGTQRSEAKNLALFNWLDWYGQGFLNEEDQQYMWWLVKTYEHNYSIFGTYWD